MVDGLRLALKKSESFKQDAERLDRWNVFTQNTVELKLSFDHVIEVIINFIVEPFENMVYENEFFCHRIN